MNGVSVMLSPYAFISGMSDTPPPFTGWSGDLSGNAEGFLRMTNNKVVIAHYATPVPDTTPPSVTAFSIPATCSSLTVPITSFDASDNVGVTGNLVNESSAAPQATQPGWAVPAPTSYTFGSAGSKTLYAWAKDAADNVSTNLSASVTITLDTARPEFRDVHVAAGKCVATFDAVAGKTYVLEGSATLDVPWSAVQTLNVTTSGPLTIEIATTGWGGFFRLRQEP
jgi:hypothetical protein